MSNNVFNRDEIVRLTTVVGSLVSSVNALTERVDILMEDHVYDLERKFAVIQSESEDIDKRLLKTESSITWLSRTILAKAIAIVGGIILWWIKSHG